MGSFLDIVDPLISTLADPAYVIDPEGRILRANRVALYTFSELQEGSHFNDLAKILGWKEGSSFLSKYLEKGEMIFRVLKDATGRAVFEVVCVPLRWSDQPGAMLVTVANIVGEAIREERYQILSRVFDSMAEGVLILDLNLRITGMNRSAVQLLGVREEEVNRIPVQEVIRLKRFKDQRRFQRAIQACRRLELNAELWLSDETAFPCFLSLSPLREMDDYLVGFVLMLRDRTAQLKMERNLIQIEKLNSLGNLVAGFAHELNNPLTSVIGFAQLLMATRQDNEYREEIGIIHTHALRCKKIVDNLLTFARKHVPERKWVDVNSVVRSTLDLLSYQLDRSEIEMVSTLTQSLPRVRADASQLQQVLVNLIENARYELKGQSGERHMGISTEQTDEWILIKLFDNGSGISEGAVEKIFDPFFTTKPPGEGTGLGLSLSYGIIQEHEGSLGVKNRREGGAEFIIKLPWSADSENEKEEGSGGDWRKRGECPCAGKRILLVEKKEQICRLMKDSLSKLAMEVDIARNGNEAIQKLNASSYDLLLLDIRLPEFDGNSLEKMILERWPSYQNRILFLTGEPLDAEGKDSILAGLDNSRVISKPFNIHFLSAKLAACLKEPASSPTEG